MKMYLANWSYDYSINSIEIVKKTDSSVWVLENGQERKHLIETNTSMYCPTYEFAREKIIQERVIIINTQKRQLAYYEKDFSDFLEKTPKTEIESFMTQYGLVDKDMINDNVPPQEK